MTLLSNAEDDDSLMRINNPAVAEELLTILYSTLCISCRKQIKP